MKENETQKEEENKEEKTESEKGKKEEKKPPTPEYEYITVEEERLRHIPHKIKL